ncbi:anthrone oxygenase family protein [Phytomonospora sp. NPDC050363]|uniref:anthrone oxygenase family protein n=1 Tax=Phytomonospora sp. NPDC050363 TaxID=3155642 RepID=UPI0033C8146B
MALFTDIVLIAAGVTSTLITGLFFGFSTAVNGALNRLTDREYLRAMKSINRVILNPVFMLCFVGSPILLILATVLHFDDTDSARFWLLAAATVVYVLGLFFVTVGANVPLNNRLEATDVDALDDKGLAETRGWFEKPWNARHTVRTLAGVVAAVLTFWALLV